MVDNYFVIERDNQWVEYASMVNQNGAAIFEEVAHMSYDDIKTYDKLNEFVVALMDASNEHFKTDDELTLVTLVGADDIFVWGILIGPTDNGDELKYMFIDWTKNGKQYRYTNN